MLPLTIANALLSRFELRIIPISAPAPHLAVPIKQHFQVMVAVDAYDQSIKSSLQGEEIVLIVENKFEAALDECYWLRASDWHLSLSYWR